MAAGLPPSRAPGCIERLRFQSLFNAQAVAPGGVRRGNCFEGIAMARAETKGFGRACVRRAVNHRAPLAIGKWEASLSWINRRIDDHGNDGFLVPVGDDVGGSGSGRAHHGGQEPAPAKIFVTTPSP